MELFLVLQPGKPGLEVLVAEGALEGPILGVEDHVLLQVRPPGEGLQADLIQDDQSTGHAVVFPQRQLGFRTGSYATFPAVALLLPLGKKLLNVFRVKPGKKVKTRPSHVCLQQITAEMNRYEIRQ